MNKGFNVNTDIEYGRKTKKFIKRNFAFCNVFSITLVAVMVFLTVACAGCSKKSKAQGNYIKTATARPNTRESSCIKKSCALPV